MKEIKFYPMSQMPLQDESDNSFSKTVLIYSEKNIVVGLGYYDFEIGEWFHFNHDSFLLKCWCYTPLPELAEDINWEVIVPKGYRKFLF